MSPDLLVTWVVGATLLFCPLYAGSRLWAHRAPRLFRVLWLAYFAKLLFPVGLWSPVANVPHGVVPPAGPGLSVLGFGSFVQPVASTQPSVPLPGLDAFWLVALLWLAGTLVTWILSFWPRSGFVDVPTTVGALRPRILLPPNFHERYDAVEQEMVLAHEREHIRALDPLYLTLAQIVVGVFWWFPGVWLARHELALVVEMACDAQVLRAQQPATVRRYGELLVRSAVDDRGPGLAFASRFGDLSRRIRSLSGRSPSRLALVVIGIALCAVLGAFSMVPQQVPLRDSASVAATPTLTWPFRAGVMAWLTTPFGPSIHPYTGEHYHHNGTDLANYLGAQVLAVADGNVVATDDDPQDLGQTVTIEHTGFMSLYGHLSRRSVAVGDHVTAGTPIGLVGATGKATGPHLHLEFRQNGAPVDAMTFTFVPKPLLGELGR